MRRRLMMLLVVLALAGAACSPEDAVALTFGQVHGPAVESEAHRVAACESGDGRHFSTVDPGAVSPTNDHGLFQINIQWKDEFEAVTGQPWSQVYHPFWNAVFAKYLYEDGVDDWSHWTCRWAA